jgi:hypothetical protein
MMDVRMLIAAVLVPALGPLTSSPQIVGPRDLSPPRAEERFERCGYEVAAPSRLSDHPPTLVPRFTPVEPADDVVVFVVRDAGEVHREDGRSLAVLIFPNAARATAAFEEGVRLVALADRVQALAAEPNSGVDRLPGPVLNVDHGPPLLLGHGLSVWRGNVAMAQLATPPMALIREVAAELDSHGLDATQASARQYDAAAEAALAKVKPRLLEEDPSRSPYGVDRDFVGCLESS